MHKIIVEWLEDKCRRLSVVDSVQMEEHRDVLGLPTKSILEEELVQKLNELFPEGNCWRVVVNETFTFLKEKGVLKDE